MNLIVTAQDAVTAFADFMEPTDAELDAIEQEMPVILAGVDLVDAQIIALDRTPNEMDNRRIRRARGPRRSPRWTAHGPPASAPRPHGP